MAKCVTSRDDATINTKYATPIPVGWHEIQDYTM